VSPSILDEGFTVLVVYDETGWIVLAFDHSLGGLGVWKNDVSHEKRPDETLVNDLLFMNY